MKKHLTLPDFMSGKQIAQVLAAVKRLRWRNGRLGSNQNHCVLGQLAHLSGVKDDYLTLQGQCPPDLADVVAANDYINDLYMSTTNKDEAVKNLCALGDEPRYPVGRWIRQLLSVQKGGQR